MLRGCKTVSEKEAEPSVCKDQATQNKFVIWLIVDVEKQESY
jgi:hypothetical protein